MRKRSALWKLYAKHVHASCNLHAFMRCEVYNKRVHVPPAEKFPVFLTNALDGGGDIRMDKLRCRLVAPRRVPRV